jgi:hypothetical protein
VLRLPLGEKLQEDIRRWLSPPDPWKNHNTARKSHSKETSTWLIEGSTFVKWKSSGLDSLLWINGKRKYLRLTPFHSTENDDFVSPAGAGKSVIWYVHRSAFPQRELMELVSSTIVEDINDLRKQGLASLGLFYCDFRDNDKTKLRGLVSSLLVQLCNHSDPYSNILSDFYTENDRGSQEPSEDALIGCLKDILGHPGQAPIYIVLDGLDECPSTSGMPSPREEVLMFVEQLIALHLGNLHICITSRPEIDITSVLNSLHFRTVILHEESGQKQDIINYVNSVVNTDKKMKTWRAADKKLVIDVLTAKAQGM